MGSNYFTQKKFKFIFPVNGEITKIGRCRNRERGLILDDKIQIKVLKVLFKSGEKIAPVKFC